MRCWSRQAQIEHKETIVVRFFNLQYAKRRRLELYYNFLTQFCDRNMFEEFEMDTEPLYLALAEKELEDCIRLEIRAEWERLWSKSSTDDFTADPVGNFFPRMCSVQHKKHDKRKPGFFKQEFRCSEMLCFCSKTYCCYDVTSNKFKISSKSLNKRVLEQSGDSPVDKFHRDLDEKDKNTSTKEVSAQQITLLLLINKWRKRCPTSIRKIIVESDGILTLLLNL